MINTINFNFEGKLFLITGATSGIGKALSLFIVKNFGKIVITSKAEAKFLDLKQLVGEKLMANVYIDLNNINEITNSFEVIKKLNYKFDGFIHCAGVAEARPLIMMDKAFYEKMFNINVFSFLEISKFLIKNNLLKNPSSIVPISSIASLYGDKAKVLYSASKGAINSAVKSMAKELAIKGVRVNSIVSGLIQTDMYTQYEDLFGKEKIDEMIKHHQYLGLGYPLDIVHAICFLLSNESRFITGTNLVADGGWLS
jgi:NAD(P)-dependent dehydrogenase (short-subunit alcohol dehydrogenase family)